jgi:hypothetical protein
LTGIVGACSECAAPLAAGQRYCIQCGLRVEPLGAPFVVVEAGAAGQPVAGEAALGPATGRARMPPPQMVSFYAAMALGFGMVVGTAIEPGLAGIQAAAPQVIVMPAEEPPPEEPADTGGGGGGAGGGGGSQFSSTPTFLPAPTVIPPSEAPINSAPKHHKTKPHPTTLTGTVVHVNPAAHSYAITTNGSQLAAIHSSKLPDPGTKLKVPVRSLSNLTNRELKGRKRLGQAESASFSGDVSFTGTIPGELPDDPAVRVYTVSSRGVSVLVRVPADQPGQPPLAVPEPGDSVQVQVDLVPVPPSPSADTAAHRASGKGTRDPAKPPTAAASVKAAATGCTPPTDPLPKPPLVADVTLLQTKLTIAEGISLKHSDMEGVVQGCPDENTLVISADDTREAGQDLTLTVSPDSGIDLSKLVKGDSIDVTGERDDGQPFTRISGLSSDQGAQGANDFSTAQGDQG